MSNALAGLLDNSAFAARVVPFVEARVLDLSEVHVVDLLAARTDEVDPDVLLGLALAVRAPQAGHVGVCLADVHERLVVESAIEDAALRASIEALDWPADRAAWHRSVVASPLVGTPAEGRPFVAVEDRVLPHRQWSYQERLRARLVERAGLSAPGVDGKALHLDVLKTGLERFFSDSEGTDLQRLGALAAMLRRLTVISGGPGTGKTFTVKKFLLLLRAQWHAEHGRDPRVVLAAPTGKAAVRMYQALLENLELLGPDAAERKWIENLDPRTLHRTLGFQPANPTRFRHGAANPLPADVVVVDEASMVDLAMMCKLVEAVPATARLVLLGDRNQLASVEAGCVLADITQGAGESGLRYSEAFLGELEALDPGRSPNELLDPTAPALADCIVHYRKPYRSKKGSGVQAVAYAIADGHLDRATAWLFGEAADGRGPFADLHSLPHAEGGRLSDQALDVVLDAYAGKEGYLPRLFCGPQGGEPLEEFHADVLRRLEAVRCLAAHRRGALGVSGLNRRIQRALVEWGPSFAAAHPDAKRPDFSGVHWLGRPILVTRNDYETELMNGDVGVVVSGGTAGAFRVVFPGQGQGPVRYRELAQLPSHETVFSMTVHKSQGSQFEHTLLVLPPTQTALLTRELIYTGLTRASGRITVVGHRKVLRDGIGREIERASALGSMLWGAT